MNDGAWHHVALVRSGETGSLFVDGRLVDARAYPSGPLDVGPLGLLVGQDQDCLGGCFQANQALDGAVDELAIYGRALADTEVAALFNAGAAGKCKPPAAPVPPEMASAKELEIALDAIDALDAEMGTLIDRLVEINVAMENFAATVHSHDRPDPGKSHRRWRRDHDDDDDDDRRRGNKHKRKHRRNHR